MARQLGVVVAALVAWGGLHVVAACNDGVPQDPPVTVDDPPDVILDESVSDEALMALLDQPVVDDATQEAHITQPETGADVSAVEPPEFTWRVGSPTTWHLDPQPGQTTPAVPRNRLGFSLISTAHAHGVPVNGRAYLLVLKNEQDNVVYRAFTADLSHVPSPENWKTVTDSSLSLTATVLNGLFINSVVVEDGGPWLGPSIGLRIIR